MNSLSILLFTLNAVSLLAAGWAFYYAGRQKQGRIEAEEDAAEMRRAAIERNDIDEEIKKMSDDDLSNYLSKFMRTED